MATNSNLKVVPSSGQSGMLKFPGLNGRLYFHLEEGHFYDLENKCADFQFLKNSKEMVSKCHAMLGDSHAHQVPSRATVEISTIGWACKLRAINNDNIDVTEAQIISDIVSTWPHKLPIPMLEFITMFSQTVQNYQRMAKDNNKCIQMLHTLNGEEVISRFREAILQPRSYWTDPIVLIGPANDPVCSEPQPSHDMEKAGYCILAKLKQVIEMARTIRSKSEQSNYGQWLFNFAEMIVRYRFLLKKSFKNGTTSRDYVTWKTLELAEKHSLLGPYRLERWLRFKQSEMEVTKTIDDAFGVRLISRTGLTKELSRMRLCETTETILLLHVPPLDVRTKQILKDIQWEVDIFAESEIWDTADEEDGKPEDVPWHMVEHKRKQLGHQISELAHQFSRNQRLATYEHVHYWIIYTKGLTYVESWFTVYVKGVLQKMKLSKIPGPPSNIRVCSMAANESGEIKEPFIRVKWIYYNEGFPAKFVVQYRTEGSHSWDEKITDETLATFIHQDIQQLQSRMEFRVAAETCFGRSKFSKIIDSESTIRDEEMKQENDRQVQKQKCCSQSSTSEAECDPSTLTVPLAKKQKMDLQPPTDLEVTSVTENTAKLKWILASGNNESSRFLCRIWCQRNGKEALMNKLNLPSNQTDCCLTKLYPKTTYSFQIVVISEDGKRESLPSETVRLTTLARLPSAEAFMKQCNKISRTNGMEFFAVPLTKSTESSTFERCVFGKAEERPRKTILLFGEFGSEKRNLINSMINYIFNVKFENTFRFQLIDEPGHRTPIRIYEINHAKGFLIPYALTIIDVPTYGDSNDLDLDQKIIKMVRLLMNDVKEIQELDIIGFIADASKPSLSPSEISFLNSIFSLFGRDLKENIRFLLTSADRVQVPPILTAISAAKFPCLKETGQPIHHKFMPLSTNDINVKCFQDFFNSLTSVKSNSLSLTRQMFEDQEQMENFKKVVLHLAKTSMIKMFEMLRHQKLIEEIQTRIDSIPSIKCEIDATEKVELPAGQLVTNCIHCSITCHNPCLIKKEIDGSLGTKSCSICPGKCAWNLHAIQPFKWDVIQESRGFPSEDEKKIHDAEMEKKIAAEKTVDFLKKDLKEIEKCEVNMRETIARSLLHLEAISLCKIDPSSILQYPFADSSIELNNH